MFDACSVLKVEMCSRFKCFLSVRCSSSHGDQGEEESPVLYLWSSDFYGWVNELRSQSGYDTLLDMARNYWAHFPIASFLGYGSTPGQKDHHPEPEVEDLK